MKRYISTFILMIAFPYLSLAARTDAGAKNTDPNLSYEGQVFAGSEKRNTVLNNLWMKCLATSSSIEDCSKFRGNLNEGLHVGSEDTAPAGKAESTASAAD